MRRRVGATTTMTSNVNVCDGNYYALAIMERLGLQESGGMLRVGAAHYNTLDEVSTLIEVLEVLQAIPE